MGSLYRFISDFLSCAFFTRTFSRHPTLVSHDEADLLSDLETWEPGGDPTGEKGSWVVLTLPDDADPSESELESCYSEL